MNQDKEFSLAQSDERRDIETKDAFLTSLLQEARAAQKHIDASGLQSDYCIAGHAIRFRFGNLLMKQRVAPAFEHLSADSHKAPALTIYIWDYVATGLGMSMPFWMIGETNDLEDYWYINNEQLNVIYKSRSKILSVIDRLHNVAYYYVQDASQLPYIESACPLIQIFSGWMGIHGKHWAHAAAVGNDRAGVIIVGKGGAGKSTTAIACLNSELRFLGDDFCLLTNDPAPHVFSLYNTAKLDVHKVDKFPHLKQSLNLAGRPVDEKAIFYLYPERQKQMISGLPLRAILLPVVTHTDNFTFKRISPAKGFLALAPSTFYQFTGEKEKPLQCFNKLAKQMPTYVFELGKDLSRIPDSILQLLSQIDK